MAFLIILQAVYFLVTFASVLRFFIKKRCSPPAQSSDEEDDRQFTMNHELR